MAIVKVLYKGEEIPIEDVTVVWTDCFGELQRPGTIEDYASDYASDEVAIAEAGEGW